jgi:hypothetical protein
MLRSSTLGKRFVTFVRQLKALTTKQAIQTVEAEPEEINQQAGYRGYGERRSEWDGGTH